MCSTAARIRANRLKLSEHNEGVHETERGMLKCFGKTANNFKAKASPQPHRALVAAHHKIELHGAKPALPRALERMRAHGPSHAAACCPGSRHVATVGDVRAAAFLIGFEKVGADDFAVVLRDEDFVARRKPERQGALAIHVARLRVGFARADNWLQDRPDRIGVFFTRSPNLHPNMLPRAASRIVHFKCFSISRLWLNHLLEGIVFQQIASFHFIAVLTLEQRTSTPKEAQCNLLS